MGTFKTPSGDGHSFSEMLSWGNGASGVRISFGVNNSATQCYIAYDGTHYNFYTFNAHDNAWHDVAIVLPTGGSKFSDVLLYVDGTLLSIASANGNQADALSLSGNGTSNSLALGKAALTSTFFWGQMAGTGRPEIAEIQVRSDDVSANWITTFQVNNRRNASTFGTLGTFS